MVLFTFKKRRIFRSAENFPSFVSPRHAAGCACGRGALSRRLRRRSGIVLFCPEQQKSTKKCSLGSGGHVAKCFAFSYEEILLRKILPPLPRSLKTLTPPARTKIKFQLYSARKQRENCTSCNSSNGAGIVRLII